MGYDEFKKDIIESVKKFKSTDIKEPIRIIGHYDCDGICATSILVNSMTLENRNYTVSIIPQVTEDEILNFSHETFNIYFFVDLGSGQLDLINKYFKEKTVFILDHHSFEQTDFGDNIIHINPHKEGVDGSSEISGSGVVFMFSKALNKKNETFAHLAVIGAIGDMQEKKGFKGLNRKILEIAVKMKKIEVRKGLRFFGIETKPLFKILAYSTDPYIPGVTGSESHSIQFLKQINIEPKINSTWKKLEHLTNEEKQRLISSLIIKRNNEKNPEDVLGNRYILIEEKTSGPTRDAKEFSTLLNACGRMGKASLGIGACLNNKKIKSKAIRCLDEYKKEIMKALRWYEDNIETENVITNDKFILINTKNNILYTIIGTLASIVSNSNNIEKGTYVMSLGYTPKNLIKVSLRISGRDNDIDLREIIKKIMNSIDENQVGGHKNAAGAYIPKEKENLFIRKAQKILSGN